MITRPPRFLRRSSWVCVFATIVAPMCGGPAAATPVTNWIVWTAPSGYPNTATGGAVPYSYASGVGGTLDFPGIGNVTTSLSGEVIDASFSPNSSAFGTSTDTFWANANTGGTTYISANVPSLPPNSDRIAVAGYGLSTQTLTFSQPVTNLVMNIWSLGTVVNPGTWSFDSPFVVLSSNDFGFQVSGNSLIGSEGSGTIQFTGTFSSLSWTIPAPELFADWNIGATSASVVPEPSTYAMALAGLGCGGISMWRRRKRA